MKSDINYNEFTTGDWTTWKDNPEWDFIDTHNLWEHPAASELAKQTRPEYLDISMTDPLECLQDLIANHWIEDALNRKDEIPEDLYDAFNIFNEVYNFEIKKHKDMLDVFTAFREKSFTEYDSYEDFIEKNGLEIDLTEENINFWKVIDFQNIVRTPLLNILTAVIVNLIIRHGYTPRREVINRTIADYILPNYYYTADDVAFKLENHNFDQKDDYIKEYLKITHQTYMIMVALYPADNIGSYLHDYMLFMNYIQDQEYYSEESEKALVLSGSFMYDSVDEDDLRTVLSGFLDREIQKKEY